jgi:hypothetical protein
MRKIKIFIDNLFKKKRTVLLTDMHNRIGDIAKVFGEGYYSVRIELTVNSAGEYDYVIQGYINNFKISSGETIEDVCKGLIAQRESKPNTIENVIVDI